jgi:transposase InsO family protein
LVDCLGEFTAACNAGGLGIPLWVRVAFPELRSRTLHKWRCDYQKNGLDGLRDKRTGGDTKTEIDANQVLQERILGLMQSAPHAPVAQLYKILGREFENLPHLATVQRWVTRWKEANPVTWAYLINPDKAKGKYQASYGDMSAGIERLYQQFEMDASPSDVRCRDGRYALLACIDVWSRRVRVLVSKTSSSQGQCTLLRQVFTQWGLPELIKTDNGKDYISERIVSVCHDLGIERKPCPRFTPEGKPHVESFFRTLSHSYLFELSKGFVGHNVGQAQAIRSQQTFASRFMNGKDQELEVDLTAAELQERLDRWIAHEYDHSAHSGLAGLTPFQRYSSYVGSVRREDPRKLDILLTEAPPTSGKGAGIRTVGKEGISAWGLTWIAAELPQWTGQEVRVRRDDLDQGRVLVFDLAWNFLCICQPAEGMAAVERQEIAVKARKLHKKLVNAAKATLKKHVAGADIVAGALNLAQQENSGLVAFPTPGFSYETAALAAAGAAVEALEQAKAPMAKTQPLPPEIQASYEQARAPKATRYTDAEFWSWTPGEMFLNLRHVPEAEMTEKQARWMREMAPNHPAVLGILQLEARLRR